MGVEQVVGYVAGTLDPMERERVEAHLADCAECTSEVVETSRLRRRDRASPRWLGVAAAAAAIIGVVIVGPRIIPRRAQAPTIRGTPSELTVSPVAPADDVTLQAFPEFTWHPLTGATAYHVAVTRATGDSVWDITTRDTTARPTVSEIEPGLFYWYVDALLEDGRSIAGGVHRFRITR